MPEGLCMEGERREQRRWRIALKRMSQRFSSPGLDIFRHRRQSEMREDEFITRGSDNWPAQAAAMDVIHLLKMGAGVLFLADLRLSGSGAKSRNAVIDCAENTASAANNSRSFERRPTGCQIPSCMAHGLQNETSLCRHAALFDITKFSNFGPVEFCVDQVPSLVSRPLQRIDDHRAAAQKRLGYYQEYRAG